jgi:hypothetical protein
VRKQERLWTAISILALVTLIGLSAAGCGGVKYTHVVTADTEYYLDGPQQARPADGVLAAGTRVRLVNESGSYSLVETSDRLRAYVASDSLQPLQ